MLKKILIVSVVIFLQGFNAYAGSDGEAALNKKKTEQITKTRDCFEKLNSQNSDIGRTLIPRFEFLFFWCISANFAHFSEKLSKSPKN